MTTLGLASRGPANGPALTFGDARSRYMDKFALSPTLQALHPPCRRFNSATISTLQADHPKGSHASFADLSTMVKFAYFPGMDATAWFKKVCQETRHEDRNPFVERFTVVPVPRKRSSKVRRSINKSLFHAFPRLPAEIRAQIWAIALEDRIYRPDMYGRVIPPLNMVKVSQFRGEIHVYTRRGYPTLFLVNREARYEAARADGGKWYPLGVGAIEIYANPKKENITVCDTYEGSRSSPLHQIANRVGTSWASSTYDPVKEAEREWDDEMYDRWLEDTDSDLEEGWWR